MDILSKQFLLSGASLALLAVILGASVNHDLHIKLDAKAFHGYETAYRYQWFHALACLALGAAAMAGFQHQLLGYAAWTFPIGTVLFSGSIYLLYLANFNPIWVRIATPVGGLILIASWVLVILAVLFKR